jgi:dUTP pyrophosphatase
MNLCNRYISDINTGHSRHSFWIKQKHLESNRYVLYICSKKMNQVTIKIINRSGNPLPRYETTGSAGMDLCAFLEQAIVLKPLERCLVPTGLYIQLPEGTEAQIRPRSGLALKRGLTLLNSPGTIDCDYRGEIGCILVNLSNEEQTISPGERIAQMVSAPYVQANLEPVEVLTLTTRGAGGFGSTGL